MAAPGCDLTTASAWILTDGKAGDEAQCLGIVEAMGIVPSIRRVAPRAPFAWAMPWGPIDPTEAPHRPGSPLAGPFPDLVIASGRRAVPYVRWLRRASGGQIFTVILKDPRTGSSAADLIWVPQHDRLRGANVVSTLTAPHRVSALRLKEARETPDPRISHLPPPRVAVLIGGNSRHHVFREADIQRFAGSLRDLTVGGASLMISTSRRTPAALTSALRQVGARPSVFLWDGSGRNPYLTMLASADAIVATADSTNMVGEAVATGAPVMVFEPSGGHPKIRAYLDALSRHGAVRPFRGALEAFRYESLDTTPILAAAIATELGRRNAALRAGRPES